MRDILLIVVVLLCSLIALRNPVFGILTFICFAFLNPHSMTWAISQTFRPVQFIAIGSIVGYLFWSEPRRFPRQRESILLLALWVIFGISTLLAIYPEKSFNFFIHVSKILLMVFLSISLINTKYRLNWLLRVIVLPLGFFGLRGGIFAIVTGGGEIVWGPENSFLYANNAIGLALAMNVPLLFYLLRIETHRWLRWIMTAMLIFSYPAVVCTYSRGAWLALGAATALIVLQHKHKIIIMITASILMMIILPSLLYLVPQRLANRYDDLANYNEEASAQTRLWTWEFCRRVGMAHPLSGAGFDFYSIEAYAKYFPDYLEIWSTKLASCHSMWFTILSEHGIPGLLLWLALIISCFLSLREMRFYGRANKEMEWVIYYANMLSVSFAAYMVAGTFVDIAYFDMFYQLVAVVVIIKEHIYHAAVKTSSTATTIVINKPIFQPQKVIGQ